MTLHLSLILSLLPFLIFTQPLQAACEQANGTLAEHTYRSDLVDGTLLYTLYLPPCYDENNTYPVLYLMHGSNSDHTHWANLGIADALDEGQALNYLPPMIVVMPNGGWMANENTFDERSWENVVVGELMPHIEATYAVSTEQENRAIGGISRGGFWAYTIALRHPDLFGSVGGHSAFFDPQNAPNEFNPLDLAARATATTRYWLDRGADDYAAYGLDLMSAALPQRNYTVYPLGEHNDNYWALHLPTYLIFYAANWESKAPPITGFVAPAPFYVPTASVFSIRASIVLDLSILDYDLVLTPTTAQALRTAGFAIHPRTRLVQPENMQTVLDVNPTSYTLRSLDELTIRERVLSIRTPENSLISAFDAISLVTDDTRWQAQRAELTRLTFSGVTALARNMTPVLDAKGVVWAANQIQAYTQASDFFHISNEVSFAPRCPDSDEPVLGGLCSKDAHFALFDELGVDLVELTGNHNNDYNFGAYLRTLDFFRNSTMQTYGGGETLDVARQPIILKHNGNTIGLLACNWNGPDIALATKSTPGATFCDRDWLLEAIPDLKAQVDMVLVSVQYAEYERRTPIDRQVNDFQFIADLGAVWVIGTQAHRPQTYALLATSNSVTTIVHYGLGNLYFDQSDLANRQFTLDTALIYNGKLVGLEVATGIIENVAQPRWMTLDEERAFLEYLMLGR